MAIKELDLIISPSIERPLQRERLSTYVNFYLPDGQKVRLTNTEFKLARVLREDTVISRRDWVLRTSEDRITSQWAYDRVGEFRPALNRKFDPVDWEVQEILPTGYIIQRSKEAARYRLNFKRKPEITVTFIPDASDPDRGRLVYPTPLAGQADEGIEIRLLHKPYPLETGGIRYLTESGWQLMDALVATLDQDATVPNTQLPTQDKREFDYFAETLGIHGIGLVNDYSVDRQGYSHDSRFRLRSIVTPGEEVSDTNSKETYEPEARPNGKATFIDFIDDHNLEAAVYKGETTNGKEPKRFRYTLDFEPLTSEQRKRILAIPFIPQPRLESLRSFVSRDRLEAWYEKVPDSLDAVSDLHLFPDDIIKLLTFLNAFAAGRAEDFDYRDPVNCVNFKGAILTCFEEYLNRYPERELTDVFQAVVITLHQPILPRQIYTRVGVQDLDFRDLWKEQENNFTREWLTYYSNVYGYCRAHVSDPEVSANLTQEVFENAWKQRNTYDPKVSFRNYLIKIATNRMADYFRLRENRNSVPFEVVEMGIPAEPLYQPRPKLDLEMERQHDIAVVREALERLKLFEDRELLRLRYWERKQFGIIASMLGKEAAAVRQQHRRLLTRLKRIIENIWLQENQPGSKRVVWTLDPDDF